ncbi:hypothetical protein EFY79_03800 [Hanamia caeni]|uniref:Uncharacterized protein n=1 Tax=Hanamia caeni TaxID=2294116 RepID=A0A3M9NMA9_9BACT|nr:hypothetical protein [Hanamia caeni]RNI38794.1 hypothetical protein EFY79_03800 [Hanamia caeni]
MKKVIFPGLVAGVVLLILSILGLYLNILIFPDLAMQYFQPAFNEQSSRIMLYFIHPFIIAMALSWFWSKIKGILKGSFLTRGIEFGIIYALIATFPAMWLVFSSITVSLQMVATWFVLGLIQAIIAGLVCEMMNP